MALTKVGFTLIKDTVKNTISGSSTAHSASFSTRVTTAESELENTIVSSSAQISTDISGSLGANASTIRTLSSATVSGSRDVASISGSLGANAGVIRTLSAATVSGSRDAASISGSRDAASISGSLGANAGVIRTLSAATVSGSFGNQRVGTTDDVKFANITGSGNVSASGNLSITGNADIDGTSNFAGNVTMQNDLVVTGRIDAEEIHTTFISSSIAQATGSNIFGDSVGDSHQFTGSLDISGSGTALRVSDGNVDFDGDLDVDGTTNLDAVDIDGDVDLAGVLTVAGSTSSNYVGSFTNTSAQGWGLFVKGGADNDDYTVRVQDKDAADLLSVKAGGRIGIGTNDPSAPLHISKDVTQVSGSAASRTNAGLNLNFDPTFGSNSLTMFAMSSSFATTAAYGIQVANSAGTTQYPLGLQPFGGQVLIGCGTPPVDVVGYNPSALSVQGTDFRGLVSIIEHQNGISGGVLAIGKSRGTVPGAVTVLQSGDIVGRLSYVSADGVDYRTISAEIRTVATGSTGANDVPGNLLFMVNDGSGVDPTERMRIASSGFVGIQTTDTSGDLNLGGNFGAPLHILQKTATQGYGLVVQGNSNANGGRIGIGEADSNFTSRANVIDIGFDSSTDFLFSRTGKDFIFGVNSAERMRITADGELLVKCTSLPNDFGSARGQLAISSTDDAGANNYATLQLQGHSIANDVLIGGIYFYDHSNNNAIIQAMRSSDTDDARLAFYTSNSGGSPNKQMTIEASGRMFYQAGSNFKTSTIGSVDRLGMIDFYDDAGYNPVLHVMSDRADPDFSPLRLTGGQDNPSSASNCIWIDFHDGDGTHRGGIQNGSTPDNPEFFNGGSDERIKTNIVDTATNGLQIINGLELKDFTVQEWYNGYSSDVTCDFVAQNAEKHFPAMVSEHKMKPKKEEFRQDFVDAGLEAVEVETALGTEEMFPVKCISHGALIPILVKALQEADDKIDALTARIEALEA